MKSKITLLAFAISMAFFSCETNVVPVDFVMCHPAAASMADFTFDKKFLAAHPVPVKKQFDLAGESIKFPCADGKEGQAYLVRSETETKKWLLLFHEWWGLNDYVKNEADFWAKELNINVLALDLYDGNLATDAETAGKLMRECNADRAKNIIRGGMGFAGEGADFRTMGWCFGGGWSLQAALVGGEKIRACVIYYGMPEQDIEVLKSLASDVVFIHPLQDKWITAEVVQKFQENMANAGKTVTVHAYDADHAFANPSSPRYNEGAAIEAREVVKAYLKDK